MTWPGLRISFYTLVHKRQCGDNSAFGSAEITGTWVTDRGLRRGDTVSRAKLLYPRARAGGGISSIWLVVRTSALIGDYGLSVRVRDGRVTTLDLYSPQGGE